MSSTQVDKFKTALANGYSEGQANVLAGWSLRDFMAFMNEVIVVGDKVWVTMDGVEQRERKIRC